MTQLTEDRIPTHAGRDTSWKGDDPIGASTARFAGEEGKFPGQCAAATRAGERCGNRATTGRAVCRMHGGASLSGIAHPRFKDGRSSRHRYGVPMAMREDYEWFCQNRDSLLKSFDEIALIQTRIQSLLDQIAEVGSADAQSQDAAYGELWGLVDLLRKLRNAEVRRIVAEREMMTADQARVFMRGVQHAVLEAIEAAGDTESQNRQKHVFAAAFRKALDLPKSN